MRPILPALACLLAVIPVAGRAQETPRIELLTMGPGEHVFTHFGHSALCVTDERSPAGRCYNWGTADFSDPLALTWDFLRGRAQFWVSVSPRADTVAAYRAEDRSLWSQTLALDATQARSFVERLDRAMTGEERYYRYHHFLDNCTTRIRDHLDQAFDGALSRDRTPTGRTWRDFALEGFGGRYPLMVGTDLVLGPFADQRVDAWEAMFLPERLREEVSGRLGVAAVELHLREAPRPSGHPDAGRLLLVGLGLALAGIALTLRRRGRPRTARLVVGLPLGLLGVILWGVYLASSLPEVGRLAVLLVLLPTDLLLPVLPSGWARRYQAMRLVGLVGVAAGMLVVTREVPSSLVWIAPILLALLPFAALRGSATRRAPAEADSDRSLAA